MHFQQTDTSIFRVFLEKVSVFRGRRYIEMSRVMDLGVKTLLFISHGLQANHLDVEFHSLHLQNVKNSINLTD